MHDDFSETHARAGDELLFAAVVAATRQRVNAGLGGFFVQAHQCARFLDEGGDAARERASGGDLAVDFGAVDGDQRRRVGRGDFLAIHQFGFGLAACVHRLFLGVVEG
ncbi:MAG: hypothetical protein ACREP7_15360, partial [Lysobacter sp.]